MQSQRVFARIPLWILADQSEFAELRNTLPTDITPALGGAVWLTENGNRLCGAGFSSVRLDNCLFSVLPTARLWCLMKLLPQWHVTSEVTEGLPQWGQSVWDNCFFTIGLTFMVLWLAVSKTAVILTWSSTSVASHNVQARPHSPCMSSVFDSSPVLVPLTPLVYYAILWSICLTATLCGQEQSFFPNKSCVPCIFPPELGSGPLYLDHPLAMYTVCGSDLGADWGERLLCAGCADSTGHHSGLALTEDGTTPVGQHYTAMHIITNISGSSFLNCIFWLVF